MDQVLEKLAPIRKKLDKYPQFQQLEVSPKWSFVVIIRLFRGVVQSTTYWAVVLVEFALN